MSAALRWTAQAADDLEAVCVYIGRDAFVAATVFAEKVLRATERLALFPESGRVVPEFNRHEIREVFVYSYRVIYRLRADVVEVITIHHGARALDESDIGA